MDSTSHGPYFRWTALPMDSTEQRTLPPIPDDLKRELEAVYAELSRDADALGAGCLARAVRGALGRAARRRRRAGVAPGVGSWIRGDCCGFDRMDHRLYASSLEVAYVL